MAKYAFKKYELTTTEIQQLAYVAKREQGTVKGARAELSLMANRYESYGSGFSSITDYILHSGWWATNSTGSTTSDKSYTDAVKSVLCNGNRTLPRYINEHDCINPPDIYKAENNGVEFPPSDRSKYKQGVTKLYNIYGGTYYFWCFPDTGADPFGYTNRSDHEKWIKKYGVKGELYYASNSVADIEDDVDASGGGGLIASPQKLYASDNYNYIKNQEDATSKSFQKLKDLQTAMKSRVDSMNTSESSNTLGNAIGKLLEDVVAGKLASLTPVEHTESKTVVKGSTSTATLPVVSVAVEAPYFEVEIGGVKFGGYHNGRVPNYVKSINVTKTNGSVNEYTIQLMHQIRAGDNPNYIDEIISKNGYDTISIRYGNANTNQIFSDSRALITDISESFDFVSCNITYTINATSVSSVVSSTRRNFPEFTGKVSDKIRKLLWEDKTSDLASVFKGMTNQLEVEKEGLIPTNDTAVTVGAQTNITTLGYLALLVSHMQNASTKNNELSNSQYMFHMIDSATGSKFKITEVTSNVSKVPFMYEVNIGYPDDNFVLGFNVNTNFSWAMAYSSASSIKKYDYGIDSDGTLLKQDIPTYYRNNDNVIGSRSLWTSLTRFPIEATLTVRGLLQDSLLMQYIKINHIMYGAKRITSGVYIVTEQTDSIGSGVYSTTFRLMRVAGDNEYVNLDGRIIT